MKKKINQSLIIINNANLSLMGRLALFSIWNKGTYKENNLIF